MKCFILSCGNDFHEGKVRGNFKLSKHRFPKDASVRAQWLRVIQKAENRSFVNFTESDLHSALVCSDHFTKSCFYETKCGRRLIKSAVPSVFTGYQCEDNSESSTSNMLPKPFLSSVETDHHSQLIEQPMNSIDPQSSNIELTSQKLSYDMQMNFKLTQVENDPNDSLFGLSQCSTSSSIYSEANHLKAQTQLPLPDPDLSSSESPVCFDSGLNNSAGSLKATQMINPIANCTVTNLLTVENGTRESAPVQRKKAMRYAGDINDSLSPEEAVVALPKLKAKLLCYRKKIRTLYAQQRRSQRKRKSMKDVFANLRIRGLISSSSSDALQDDFGTNNALLKELVHHNPRQPYSQLLRTFATTLHFYSPKAYRYVRRVFKNKLPATRTLVRWYVSVGGEPGITKEALLSLKMKANEYARQGKPLLVALVMDEMAIRQQILWNKHSKKIDGVPSNVPNHLEVPAAREALMFMVTGVDEAWKIPIGYFLVESMNADTKKNLILTILENLHLSGVTVISFTFDGTQTNIRTASILGCDFGASPLRTSFPHPSTGNNVYVLLDIVHMLKLVRNTLHAKGTLHTQCGPAKWSHIAALHDWQNAKGLRIACNLTDNHIRFENNKMKVILAVQVLSQSVADALRFLQTRVEAFKECQGTIEFLEIFNDLFDLGNSMHETDTGFKAPLSEKNFDFYVEAFQYAENYIRSITLEDGTPILESKNKTGFLGFLVGIESFRQLYADYCEINSNEHFKEVENPAGIQKPPLEKIFTYRFCQDHIEMFFGAIRSKSGCNNNPNAGQLKAAYKRLLMSNDVRTSSFANCTDFNNTFDLPSTVDKFSAAAISEYSNNVLKILSKTKMYEQLSDDAEQLYRTVFFICRLTEYQFKRLVVNQQTNIEKLYWPLVNYVTDCIMFQFPDTMQYWSQKCGESQSLTLLDLTIRTFYDLRFSTYCKQIIQFKASNRQKFTKIILFQGT